MPSRDLVRAPDGSLHPAGTSRDVNARVALACVLPRPFGPVLGPLEAWETEVLRCHGLDERLFEVLAGVRVPRDLLRTPAARARALADLLPDGGVPILEAAVWIHLGGPAPSVLWIAHVGRRGLRDGLGYSRMVIPPEEIDDVGGVPCASLARAVTDLACTAPPGLAVEAVLRARDAGLHRNRLDLALAGRTGGAQRGAPRARRIINAILPRRLPHD